VLTCSSNCNYPANSIANYAGSSGGSGGSTDDANPANARFRAPRGLSLDGSGNLFVADYTNCTVRRVAAGGGAVITLAGVALTCNSTGSNLNGPNMVAAESGANPNVYVADTTNNKIKKLACSASCDTAGNWSISDLAGDGTAGSGDCTGVSPPTTSSCRLSGPTGVWVDSSTGAIYVAGTGNNKVRKVTSSSLTTIVGTGTSGNAGDGSGALLATLTSPYSVTTLPGSHLFIASGNKIRKAIGPL
jgi:hypothetical protein